MLTAIPINLSDAVIAREVAKSDGPFECPECRSEVILRKGRIKAHHFAHKPPVDCGYGLGETDLHRQAKLAIFDMLSASPNCINVALEASIKGIVRPDVRARIRGTPVAIEVQRSTLSVKEIERRTRCYRDMQIYVIWIQPFGAPFEGERISPHQWEKWVHGLYFGRIHHWNGGFEIIPVHYGDDLIWVPESEWYEEGGNLRQEGGYYKTSKRWRTAKLGEPCFIDDCRPIQREPWQDVPVANIWQSPGPNWW